MTSGRCWSQLRMILNNSKSPVLQNSNVYLLGYSFECNRGHGGRDSEQKTIGTLCFLPWTLLSFPLPNMRVSACFWGVLQKVNHKKERCRKLTEAYCTMAPGEGALRWNLRWNLMYLHGSFKPPIYECLKLRKIVLLSCSGRMLADYHEELLKGNFLLFPVIRFRQRTLSSTASIIKEISASRFRRDLLQAEC